MEPVVSVYFNESLSLTSKDYHNDSTALHGSPYIRQSVSQSVGRSVALA